jgi:hypothetical protein
MEHGVCSREPQQLAPVLSALAGELSFGNASIWMKINALRITEDVALFILV